MDIKIQKCGNNVLIPKYQHAGDAGIDFHVNNFKKIFKPVMMNEGWAESEDNLEESLDEIELDPGCRILIGTGLKMEIPEGIELQIRPRSGLALKSGITVINSPGTIDSGYKSEIGIILINHSVMPFTIKKGERIAQAVFANYIKVNMQEGELSESERGDKGFGSSGK